MDKQIITFSANEQNLVRIGGEYHYSSNKVSYIGAHFDLGANWDGFDSVRAVWFTDRINGISTVLDGEGNCTVPTEVLKKKDRVFVNLVGSIVSNGELTDRLTTYPAVALVVDSKAKVDSTETAPVTPSQFEQFVSIVQDAVANIKDIVSTTLNADYTLTFVYSDGTSYTTPSIRGERGPQGADGADGTDGNGIASAVLNSNYTLTLTFTDGTSYTTPSIRGAQGPKGDTGDVSQAQLDAAVSDLKSDLIGLEGITHQITDSDFTKIEGYISSSGSVISNTQNWHSTPIQLNKGEKISLTQQYQSSQTVIALTDASGSYYIPVVQSSSAKSYEYIANDDVYVSIGSLYSGTHAVAITEYGKMGNFSQLKTTAKQNVVEPINEIYGLATQSTKEIPSTSYSKIDGNVNGNNEVVSLDNFWHSSPIELKKGETIRITADYQGSTAFAVTDSTSSFYMHIANWTSAKDESFTAPVDCYVSIGYLKSSSSTYRELKSCTITSPAYGASLGYTYSDADIYKYDKLKNLIENDQGKSKIALWHSEDASNFKNAIFERYKSLAEVKRLDSTHILASGSCGYSDDGNGNITDGTITWEIYDNGVLYIHGYGKMYDFIKGTSACKTVNEVNAEVTRLGSDFWYYGFIEPNANNIESAYSGDDYVYDTDEVITYSEKRYAPNGEQTNPINSLPYGYSAPWYIYRNEISLGDGLNADDDSYTGHATYNVQNPNGIIYDRVCIEEDLAHGGITYIGDWAFYRCCVDSLVLPSKVTKIGCWGIRYSPTMRTLVMQDLIEEIEDHGVSRNQALISIRMSQALESAGYASFSNNPCIRWIIFPSSFTNAGSYLATNNTALDTIDFGSVLDIPMFAVSACQALQNVVWNSDLESIGHSAFANTAIKNAVIGESVTDIGTQAFANVLDGMVTIDSDTVSGGIDSGSAFGNLINRCTVCRIKSGNTINSKIRGTFFSVGEIDGYEMFVKISNLQPR